MRGRLGALLMVLAVAGCGESHRSIRDAGSRPDGGQRDGGRIVDPDAGPPIDAGRVVDDGGPIPLDAGPPEECDSPGAIETVPCGDCGTVDRFCSADGAWAYGTCSGEGVCSPGTTGSMACGDCGTQSTRCTAACAWEPVGACTAEGECAPGERTRTSDGCPAGQTRELSCNDSCTFVEDMACAPDGCPTPGTIESVPCGMCGSQERFCNASRVWEYGTCTGEGVCMPGTTGTTSCGMCGTQPTRCTTACTWMASSTCTGEGTCAPGSMTRTSAGCPAGQTQLMRCNAMCAYESIEACRADAPVDVLLLFDVTGSHALRVRDESATLINRLIRPLIGLGDVAVGIAYYADFPVSSYGSSGDRPFEGGIEPTRTSSTVEAELATSPSRSGGDWPESGVEALSVLTGGALPASALPLTCSSGRTSGGCWRSGAERIVILYTDAPQHNGPDPAGTGLYSAYTGITPAPATWPTVLTAMTSQRVELIVLNHDSTTYPEGRSQHVEMISDLGQPASNLLNATGPSLLATACDAAVARVRAIGGY